MTDLNTGTSMINREVTVKDNQQQPLSYVMSMSPARGGSSNIVGVWGEGTVSLWDARSQQLSEVGRLPKPPTTAATTRQGVHGARHTAGAAGACVASWKAPGSTSVYVGYRDGNVLEWDFRM